MIKMADNKKETERAELHRTIWGIANDLRGSVDGWDFKQYVLGMLFYRYISENLDNYISKGEWEAGNKDFHYSNLSDKEAETVKDDIVKEKGFFILPSQLFCNVLEKANFTRNESYVFKWYFVGNKTKEQILEKLNISATFIPAAMAPDSTEAAYRPAPSIAAPAMN